MVGFGVAGLKRRRPAFRLIWTGSLPFAGVRLNSAYSRYVGLSREEFVENAVKNGAVPEREGSD